MRGRDSVWLRKIVARLVVAALLTNCFASTGARGAQQKVKIRAITAFVQFVRNRAHLESQFNEALQSLQKAKTVFTNAGYEVQTMRITPQAFGVITRGLSHNEILSFYAELAELDRKAGI